MFLEIEGDRLINLSLISRVELYHQEHKRYAILWNAGVMECESHIAYQYFTQNRDNPDLFIKVAAVAAV